MSSRLPPEFDAGRAVRRGVHSVGRWANENVGTAVAVVTIIVAWEAVARLFVQNPAYFPGFSFSYRQTLASSDQIVAGFEQTFSAVLMAFPVAVSLGVVLGIIFSESYLVRQTSMPILVFSYAIPHAILAPMFLLWFGLGLPGITAFAIWIAFFPTFVNTLTSMSTVDPEMTKLADITGATRWQRIRYLKFFKAVPDIISGIRISIQMTIVGVVVAEFIAGGVGLGHLIQQSTYRGRLGLTFGAVVTIAVGAIILFKIITYLLNRLDPTRRATSS